MDRYSPSRSNSFRQGMSSKFSPSKFSMTLRGAGVDSRELIINQLKRDIINIKASEKNLNNVNSQLSTLEHKFRLLQDEKNILDKDTRMRTEANIRQIAQLKSKGDNHKRTLEHSNREYENLLNDLTELENLGENKKLQLEKLTNDEKDAYELRVNIEEELRKANKRVVKNRDSQRDIIEDIEITNKKLDRLVEQDTRFEKKFTMSEEEIRLKERSGAQLGKTIAQCERESDYLNEICRELSEQTEFTSKNIVELEVEKDRIRREIEGNNGALSVVRVNIKKAEGENSDIDSDIHSVSLDIKRLNGDMNTKNTEFTRYKRLVEEAMKVNDVKDREILDLKSQIQENINLNKEIVATLDDFEISADYIGSRMGNVYSERGMSAYSMKSK